MLKKSYQGQTDLVIISINLRLCKLILSLSLFCVLSEPLSVPVFLFINVGRFDRKFLFRFYIFPDS